MNLNFKRYFPVVLNFATCIYRIG